MGALKVEIELPRDLLVALNIAESDLGRRAQEWVILELFQEGEISAGKAAEILGTTKPRLLDLLAQRGLPYFDASPRELQRGLAAAEAAFKTAPDLVAQAAPFDRLLTRYPPGQAEAALQDLLSARE